MRTVACCIGLLGACLLWAALPVRAAELVRHDRSFAVGGATIEEIAKELSRRGPRVHSTGHNHPAATRMQFSTELGYRNEDGRCRLSRARTRVTVEVILPRWTGRRKAAEEVRILWDTLAADIRRHEEGHIVIARNHARQLESELRALYPERSCERLQAKVKATTAAVLAAHEEAQTRYDRIDNTNFSDRFARLLSYRLERMRREN